MDDNRKYSRVDFKIACKYKSGGREIPCRLVNLSLKGLLAEIEDQHDIEPREGIIEMKLLNSDITIYFEAEIVHKKGNQIGFRFTKTDVESMTHLRAILEANTGNPDKIDEELHSLVKDNKRDAEEGITRG
jgi:c-di-GMP-binding flagellar brake protein YcgR